MGTQRGCKSGDIAINAWTLQGSKNGTKQSTQGYCKVVRVVTKQSMRGHSEAVSVGTQRGSKCGDTARQ